MGANMGCQACHSGDEQTDVSGKDVPQLITDENLSLTGAAVPEAAAAAEPEMPSPEERKLEFLSNVLLFKRMPQEQHSTLASACETEIWKAGHTLIKQGDTGDAFFVMSDGLVSVHVDGNKVASLSVGDYFGEKSLLHNEPRTATIIADTEIEVLKITRCKFCEFGLHEKLDFAKRQAIVGGTDRPVVAKPPSLKTAEDCSLIVDALMSNKNLESMMKLTEAKCKKLAEVAWVEDIPAGQKVIGQGDLNADYFYIVKDGSFAITVMQDQSEKENKPHELNTVTTGQQVGEVSSGGSFGELALLYLAPRAATITATVDSVVFVVDRISFKTVLIKSAQAAAMPFTKYLAKVELFNSLNDVEKQGVASALLESSFSKDQFVFEQGEKGDKFFILHSGEVAVIKDNKVVTKLRGTPQKAQIFGELALLGGDVRSASIKVTSDTAKTLSLDKESFDLLIGPLEALKKRGKGGGPSKLKSALSHARNMVQFKLAAAKKQKEIEEKGHIYKKDLTKLGLLGCGGFGAVELVQHDVSKETYALKSVNKGYVVQCGMKTGILNEKEIQYMCDSPFIVRLYETYNDKQTLLFLMEIALGGELYSTYYKKQFFGSAEHAKFYLAGTVIAFDHLHERKVVYRDLKPENILITEKGFMKLTDMGLAKVVVGKTHTTCGTPDYFAPELIANTGHHHAVDWWALGILSFELMCGHPPFEANSPVQTYAKITRGIAKVKMPANIKNTPMEDFVKSLCKAAPSERLPMLKTGSDNIRMHQWYEGFDWKAMQELRLVAPYVPTVKGKADLDNFTASEEDLPPQVPYKDDGSEWDKEFATCQ